VQQFNGPSRASLEKQDKVKLAIWKNDENSLQTLLSQHPELFFLTDSEGKNLFHYAAHYGQTAMIKTLVKLQFTGLDSPDHHGLTPLHLAIHEGRTEAVMALIHAGARLDRTWETPHYRVLPPFAMAIAAGYPKILQALIKEDKHQHINLKDKIVGVGNVLHLAIDSDQALMLEYLIQNHPEIVRDLSVEKDGSRRTPLQLAAYLGDLYAIRLLHQQGVDLNQGKDQEGGTAVHYAARGHKPDAIQLLDWLGADLRALDNNDSPPIQQIDKTIKIPDALRCRDLLARLPQIDKRAKTEPPNYKRRPPFNLVLQGGGPKGIAYAGALKQLEEEFLLCQLKRVAGSSAGAITAALIAMGYRADEVKTVLFDLDFMSLLDAKGQLEGTILAQKDDPTKKAAIKIVLREYWHSWKNNPLHPIEAARTLFQKLNSISGLCQGEVLRSEVERLIAEKTGIQHCTFAELHALSCQTPDKYKELHVFATHLQRLQSSELIRFSHEDRRWHDLIISDAIRASASIPGIFTPHTLHFKDAAGVRHPRPHHGIFVDGGVLQNFPLEAFDNNKYQEDRHQYGEQTNRRTLGLSLEAPQPLTVEAIDALDSTFDLSVAIARTYLYAEEIVRKEKGITGRTIQIPVPEGIGTLTFELTKEQKEALMTSGKKSVDFFSKTSR